MRENDYLTVKEAAEYIGVSMQTLRRWETAGKLLPIRHPSNGYRLYKRASLEPFKPEYQRGIMQNNQIFKEIPADIENNPKLREPQKEAHKAVRKHFASHSEPATIQIPVGCGKTGVMATLPFGVADSKVLIIAPNLTIREGIAASLDISNPQNFWRKTGVLRDFSSGPYRTVLDGENANLHDCNESHFVIANIQQLASSADRWLPQFPDDYFDMIFVDEGHHNVAPSWQKVFKKFPNAKVINLTATPFRGDGKKPDGTVIYKYPFSRAMINGYIKQIHSRNVAPEELYFTEKGSTRKLSLEEVMDLREEAWFRRGIALSRECNLHIVEYSMNYLNELRERSGHKHQLIASACSVDHARQVRSLYEERGCKAKEIYSEMDSDQKEEIIDELKRGKLDCIVQVQMLGEGFDHPNLSVAAIFRPYRSLAPYIQFVGRVMRVIFEGKPDSPDNHAYIVSHVGLNNDAQWDDFRELDLGDQEIFKKWMNQQEADPDSARGTGEPRRFDQGILVNNEILSDFIASQTFLDPNDDRVLDEFLNKEIGPGIKLKDLMPREALRVKLEEFVEQNKKAEVFAEIPVQPQKQRQEAKKRLNERARAVAMRVLKDLGVPMKGRSFKVPKNNDMIAYEAVQSAVNTFLNITSNQRSRISLQQANTAYDNLDKIGDDVREILRKGLRNA